MVGKQNTSAMCTQKYNKTEQLVTKTKLCILHYRRNVKIRECLQYPEQTDSTLSTSGTKDIKEGKSSQPATAVYPNNINYKREDGNPLHSS